MFNTYRFSVTTSTQQKAVRSLLSQQGIKVDVFANTRKSLSAVTCLAEVTLLNAEQARIEKEDAQEKREARNAKARARRQEQKARAQQAPAPAPSHDNVVRLFG